MENLLLDNQVIILESDYTLDSLKKKIRQMQDIIFKFSFAIEGVYPRYTEILNDFRTRLCAWENSMNEADSPKCLLMCELVRYIDQVKNEIERSGVDFSKRTEEDYVGTLFSVDPNTEYEPIYFLRPVAIDFISIWNNSETTLVTKKQIVNYLYLIHEFSKSIINSFSIMSKEDFEEKFGFDYANFDLDNMNFNVKSISDSFAKMIKSDNSDVDTNPLTETVNTVLTEFLGIENADQNINLKTLQELHNNSNSGSLYEKLDKISAALDSKGIGDEELVNSVKSLSAAFNKNSGVKNPKMKALFEKLANGIDLENPDTLIECQQLMHDNPIFQQMGIDVSKLREQAEMTHRPQVNTHVKQKKKVKSKSKSKSKSK
jgi:hypothetical protein